MVHIDRHAINIHSVVSCSFSTHVSNNATFSSTISFLKFDVLTFQQESDDYPAVIPMEKAANEKPFSDLIQKFKEYYGTSPSFVVRVPGR